ncbi:MAG TPA: EAL domain-containing protein [Steroidobacteraceae bacterium]|nr:EAL domain-containing protein [Steroidobacteraceae bacterium]
MPAHLRPSAARAPGRRRLSVGGHLILGLAMVAIVVLAGQVATDHTTGAAIRAVRSLQLEYEPLAQRAGAVEGQLAAFDRSVGQALESEHAAGTAQDEVAAAQQGLRDSVDAYFALAPAASDAANLRARIARHVELGASLAAQAGVRGEWLHRRHQLLDAVVRRIDEAGGTGLVINDRQVLARRSLAELATAADALRAATDARSAAAAEHDLGACLQRHHAELEHSPGPAWLELEQTDLAQAIRLRDEVERFDAANDAARHDFAADGAALIAASQALLQEPARRGLAQAAERAAAAAGQAQHTLVLTGIAVVAVLLLVFVALAVGIIAPVRRLLRATTALARGDRSVRASGGGSAEIARLADSFNAMAAQVQSAEHELRAYQAELEQHVEHRTHQLQHLANHDPLTQLPNRRYLSARLASALMTAASSQSRLGLLFVDLDNFKAVNDTLGHSFGDRLLQLVGERLGRALPPHAFIARLGGDEFTALLENVPSTEVVTAYATTVVETLQQPLSIDGRSLTISASVGASVYPDHAGDADALLRTADAALFHAKDLGRNRCALYTPRLYDAAAHRFRLEQALRRAVDAGELALMYQPLVSLDTLEPAGVEALLRWRKSGGRIATAAEFVDIAEESGLMRDLTVWALRAATSTATAWRAMGWAGARVAINVSARQFVESGFVDSVRTALAATGLPGDALEIEVTETVIQTGKATIEALHQLREAGVAVALDDFGTGYSSLASLARLPITRVKLDRSLIQDIDQSPRSAAIARSMIALCHGLGLEVVTEGVERPGQLELLSQCGPLTVQGFLLSPPVEMQVAPQEAEAAASRARALLRNVAGAAQANPGAVRFAGPKPRQIKPRLPAG